MSSPGNKSKKTPLSETQKKRNHIDSEKHRRNAIEAAFQVLSMIVPDAQGLSKSENKLLDRSLAYAKRLIEERARLLQIAETSGVETDDIIPQQHER